MPWSLPTKHYETLLQMPPTEVGKLYSLVPAIAKAIISAVKADGFNVGQNNGISCKPDCPARTRSHSTSVSLMTAQMENGLPGELLLRKIYLK